MINKINKLSQSEFIKVFANIFENSSWIALELYKEKPFNNFKNLSTKMLDIFDKITKEKHLKILKAHPDLAGKKKILSNFRQRVSCDINVEFEEAKKQVKKIASLRLNEINKK